MVLAPFSASFQSLPPLPTIKLGPSSADSQVGGWACACSRPLWVSPTNSPVCLGVSPAATSTPTCVFYQWFEALFPGSGTLGCVVCFAPLPFLPVYPCANVGPQGLPATALPQVLTARFPVSTPPTSLDECFFFISVVVGLPYSSIFCQFVLFFVFKLLLSFFWLW